MTAARRTTLPVYYSTTTSLHLSTLHIPLSPLPMVPTGIKPTATSGKTRAATTFSANSRPYSLRWTQMSTKMSLHQQLLPHPPPKRKVKGEGIRRRLAHRLVSLHAPLHLCRPLKRVLQAIPYPTICRHVFLPLVCPNQPHFCFRPQFTYTTSSLLVHITVQPERIVLTWCLYPIAKNLFLSHARFR